MGRLIVLLFATATVWGSVAWMLTSTPTPDNFVYLILGFAAFLSTGIIWGIGGSIDMGRRHEPPRQQETNWDSAKPKNSAGSLASVVDTLTPEQVTALEVALQRRHDTFDEDEQILVNRLAAEMQRSASQQR